MAEEEKDLKPKRRRRKKWIGDVINALSLAAGIGGGGLSLHAMNLIPLKGMPYIMRYVFVPIGKIGISTAVAGVATMGIKTTAEQSLALSEQIQEEFGILPEEAEEETEVESEEAEEETEVEATS